MMSAAARIMGGMACLLASGPAFAQEVPFPFPAAATSGTTNSAATQDGFFPALPPSRPCVQGNMTGAWRLAQVYENPVAGEVAAFSAQPYQYIYFGEDNIYNSYASTLNTDTEPAVVDKLKKRTADHYQQFVVQSGGMVYFYDNGVASRTLACFIVANGTGQFKVGQLLLMPPINEAAGGRLVKVYDKVQLPTSRQVRQSQRNAQKEIMDRVLGENATAAPAAKPAKRRGKRKTRRVRRR